MRSGTGSCGGREARHDALFHEPSHRRTRRAMSHAPETVPYRSTAGWMRNGPRVGPAPLPAPDGFHCSRSSLLLAESCLLLAEATSFRRRFPACVSGLYILAIAGIGSGFRTGFSGVFSSGFGLRLRGCVVLAAPFSAAACSASSSSVSSLRAMEMISSFLSGLASVTPWVVRPVRLTSATLERMTLPDFMMAMIWSDSSTITHPPGSHGLRRAAQP